DHVFMYWVISETEKITIPGRELNMSRNVTLVPQWKEMYVIAFWADEDELFEVGDKLQGTDYEISFFAPAKEGYEFFCWKSRAHNEYYYPGEVYKRDEAMGFDAVWVENGKKKIVYSMGDVDGNFYEQDADVNAPIAIYTATPTKEGCTFNGWTVKEVPVEPTESVQTYSLMRTASNNISNGQYVGEDSAILTPDMTGSFTIEYLGRDGSVIYTQYKEFGEDIALWGENLVDIGYELVGWYTTNENHIYRPGGRFGLNKDTRLNSKWFPSSDFIGISIFNKPENSILYVGENYRLNAVATPPYLTAKCTWEVDNENIATIDKNGVITPKSEGTITVTVEAKENENDDISYSDSCSLVIEERLDGRNLTPHGDFKKYTCSKAAVCNDGIGCDYGDYFHQDSTAYMGGILNADSHRYIVLPTNAENYRSYLGCVGVSIRSNGRYAFGVVGDGGQGNKPQKTVDEFSVRMIKDLGYKTDGANDVSPEDPVTTYIFPETKRSSWVSKTLNIDVAAEGMKYFY
ncbi:MAG: hypothetical protein E7406_09510, partial [Ruminococcaceae bacterium]|nr:hypothetical protein [Oscillospiraceae bacterium]